MLDPRSPDFRNTPFGPGRPKGWHRPALRGPEKPAVSVVTPYYNKGERFAETAACVLGQTLQNFEWIIVDDCSTEAASRRVLDAYRTIDARVRVIDMSTNSGPSVARNVGAQSARADFVFHLDADDLIEPTALEKSVWCLHSYPGAGFVKGWSVGFGALEYLWQRGPHEGRAILDENLMTTTGLVRKSLLETIGGFDTGNRSGLEDWDFWLRCARAGVWGRQIHEVLDWYRRRTDHKQTWEHWDKADEFRRALRERYPELQHKGAFPAYPEAPPIAMEGVRRDLPVANPLAPCEKPRLLMIVPWLAMGGADRFNLLLTEHLSREGWEITIATTHPENTPWEPVFGRHTQDIHVLHRFLRPVDHPAYLRYLIESRGPDVVMLSNSEPGFACLPYLRAFAPAGTAFVDYSHMEEPAWRSGGHPRSAVGMSEQFDLLLCCSEHLSRWQAERGVEPTRTRAVHINVDTKDFHPDAQDRARTRETLAISERTPVLLYAGRICQQKQPRVFAQTMSWLVSQRRDIVALVAGDGPDRAMLERELRGPIAGGQVRMLGSVSPAEMRSLMRAADIFFLPSEWEGIALVLYEAMATGAVVVGADVGGQRELVTPETGVLLPRGTVESEAAAYARAIAGLCDDPGRMRAMSEAALARIRGHFTIEQMIARIKGQFAEAVRLAGEEPRQRLSPGVACELATRGVEGQRLHDLAEHLWHELDRARAGNQRGLGIDSSLTASEAELARIGNSRAWRTASRIRGVLGRNGLARGGVLESKLTPEQRLDLMRSSRTYRLLLALKANPVYRAYARRKYGS
jgi:glycosyltransferase involved in cell wall biosynthesis/GT2 family glycosyltransferase